MSKGSGRRPTLIDREEFQKNWDRIFNSKVVSDGQVEEGEERASKEAPVLPVSSSQGQVCSR